MNLCFWLIPFFGALIALVVIYVLYKCLQKCLDSKVNGKGELDIFLAHEAQGIKEMVKDKIGEMDFQKTLEPLLDVKLESLLQKFQTQIPMAGMFLAGPLGKKLKDQAKEEILKMLPEVQKSLVGKFLEDFDLEAMLKEKVQQFIAQRLPQLVREFLAKSGKKYLLLIALAGFLMGCVELALILFFCS